MTTDNTRSWLTGNQLKYCAAALMVLDHMHEFIFPGVVWLTILGRLVAPIFIFMVAEGMYYTHSRKSYALQLLIGAEAMSLISLAINRIFVLPPIDWDAVERGVPVGARSVGNNIFATMFMITLLIIVIDYGIKGIKEKRVKQVLLGVLALAAIVGLAFAVQTLTGHVAFWAMDGKVPQIAFDACVMLPTLFNTEGGMYCIFLGVAFYYTRRWRWVQMLALAAISVYYFFTFHSYTSGVVQWMMGFAAVPLFFYNGKRGRGVNPQFDKWFFYIFYPVHIYTLFIIAWALQR